MMHRNTILAMLLIASPILFVLIAYSDTFSMSWNQGRGGFLFGLAFIVAEIVGIKFDRVRMENPTVTVIDV